jgi:hypothetical protein
MEANDNILKQVEESIKSAFAQYGNALKTNVSGDAIMKIMNDLDEKAHDVTKTFASGRDNMMGLKAAMADAVTSVQLLGGEFSNIAIIQEEVAKSLGRNVILNKDSYAQLYAAQVVSGQKAEDIVKAFKNAGASAYQAGKDMQTVIDSSRAIGVNAFQVSKMVLDNTEMMNRYNFVGGVEGLSKMAAQAVSLRVDMKETMQFAKDVFKPDGAIEMAAALQRLGVAQSDLLDPLRLMDLSANDPTELQNQIVQMTQQFVQLGKSGHFEIMPGAKRQFQEIATAMNIPYETLTKMALGSQELDDKMKKIKFPEFATEDQRKMIANLAEMNKSGNGYEISFSDREGKLQTKDVTKLDDEDIKQIAKFGESKPMEVIAKESLDNIRDIAANIKAIAQKGGFAAAASVPGQYLQQAPRDISESFRKTFDNESTQIKTLREGINKNVGGMLNTINDLVSGKKSLPDALKTLQTSFDSASNYFGKLKDDTIKNAKGAGVDMLNSENPYIQIAAKALERLVANEMKGTAPEKKVNDFMINGQNLVTNPADTIFGGTGAEKFFESVNKLTSNTNNTGMVDNSSQNMNSTLDINFKLQVDSNQNIDMAQLERAFNNTALKEKIIEVATLGMERFSPEASVRKKMNPYVKSMNG